MESKIKKMLVYVSAFALAMSLMTAAAFASDDTLNRGLTDPFSFEEKADLPDKSEMPAKYDLRDKGFVTPVKFQNPWGTCWGFAAISAAETSILSDMGKTYDETKLDLSERHLAWFSLTHISDPEDPQCGEGHWSTNKETRKIPWMCFNDGAEGFFATTLFASGIGPQYEKDFPYINKGGIITWRKADGSTVDSLTSPGDEYSPYCYAKYSEDYPGQCSWAVSESDRFKQKFELKESCMLPTPSGRDENGNYKYNEEGTLAIKDRLLEGEAVQIGFLADQSKPDEQGEGKYLNNITWAQYTYETKRCNHAVCIVGYDDNYSRENFNSSHQPPGDGAWIVKNSWGAETNEFPHKGKGVWGVLDDNGKHTGYFYLSYYDQTLTHPETLSFYTNKKSSAQNFYYIDEYDFMPVYDIGNIKTEDDVRMANLFKAEGNETLRAVSCQTATPNSHVVYRIYTTDKGMSDIGEPVSVQEADYKYGGYHRTTLDKPVLVKKGQKYAVEVEITTESGIHEMLVAKAYGEGSLTDGHNPTGDQGYVLGVINKGESFICENGKYRDFTEVVKELKAEDQEKYGSDEYYSYDNFAIKGYADPSIIHDPAAVIKNINAGKKYAVIKWKKAKQADGYQLAYKKSTSKKWTEKFVSINPTSKKISKLKSGKKYSFKIRAYVKSDTAKTYGKWSKVKTVKIK